MNRLLLAIAVIFAFAAAGPTIAPAAASDHLWTVAETVNGWCLEPAEQQHEAPVFKPCAKKINGKAILCEQSPAVLPGVDDCRFGATPLSQRLFPNRLAAALSAEGRFRPPRGVAGA